MKILIAVKGREGNEYYRRAAELAPLRDAVEIILAHVVDSTPRADMDASRERFLGRRALGEERRAELTRAEDERAQAGLQVAVQALADAGIAESRLHAVILRGKPNEELHRLAEREAVDLVIVQGRGGKPGPHSLGKTARFMVDHAPQAALLIR